MRAIGLVWQESVETRADLEDTDSDPYDVRFVAEDRSVYVRGLNGQWALLSMGPTISTRALSLQVEANAYERIFYQTL